MYNYFYLIISLYIIYYGACQQDEYHHHQEPKNYNLRPSTHYQYDEHTLNAEQNKQYYGSHPTQQLYHRDNEESRGYDKHLPENMQHRAKGLQLTDETTGTDQAVYYDESSQNNLGLNEGNHDINSRSEESDIAAPRNTDEHAESEYVNNDFKNYLQLPVEQGGGYHKITHLPHNSRSSLANQYPLPPPPLQNNAWSNRPYDTHSLPSQISLNTRTPQYPQYRSPGTSEIEQRNEQQQELEENLDHQSLPPPPPETGFSVYTPTQHPAIQYPLEHTPDLSQINNLPAENELPPTPLEQDGSTDDPSILPPIQTILDDIKKGVIVITGVKVSASGLRMLGGTALRSLTGESIFCCKKRQFFRNSQGQLIEYPGTLSPSGHLNNWEWELGPTVDLPTLSDTLDTLFINPQFKLSSERASKRALNHGYKRQLISDLEGHTTTTENIRRFSDVLNRQLGALITLFSDGREAPVKRAMQEFNIILGTFDTTGNAQALKSSLDLLNDEIHDILNHWVIEKNQRHYMTEILTLSKQFLNSIKLTPGKMLANLQHLSLNLKELVNRLSRIQRLTIKPKLDITGVDITNSSDTAVDILFGTADIAFYNPPQDAILKQAFEVFKEETAHLNTRLSRELLDVAERPTHVLHLATNNLDSIYHQVTAVIKMLESLSIKFQQAAELVPTALRNEKNLALAKAAKLNAAVQAATNLKRSIIEASEYSGAGELYNEQASLLFIPTDYTPHYNQINHLTTHEKIYPSGQSTTYVPLSQGYQTTRDPTQQYTRSDIPNTFHTTSGPVNNEQTSPGFIPIATIKHLFALNVPKPNHLQKTLGISTNYPRFHLLRSFGNIMSDRLNTLPLLSTQLIKDSTMVRGMRTIAIGSITSLASFGINNFEYIIDAYLQSSSCTPESTRRKLNVFRAEAIIGTPFKLMNRLTQQSQIGETSQSTLNYPQTMQPNPNLSKSSTEEETICQIRHKSLVAIKQWLVNLRSIITALSHLAMADTSEKSHSAYTNLIILLQSCRVQQ